MRLRLEKVSAGYPGVTVLRDVDLVVPSGAAVALVGANGAGKTTLLQTAAGAIRPTGGRIWFDDRAVERWRPAARSKAGLCLIPEGRGIFRLLTVRENLAMQAGGRNVGEAIDRAASLFPKLGARLGQVAGTMSGGEQQMLAMARAYVSGAPLVLADELSMGLAPVIVDEIFEALQLLRAEGRSLLIVEQFVDLVLSMVDFVYVLHKGRVGFVGEPSQCRSSQLFERYMAGAAT